MSLNIAPIAALAALTLFMVAALISVNAPAQAQAQAQAQAPVATAA